MPARLGDDIDDFCIKCKRLTNHSIVSLLEEKPAKVRCRTCYHDHDFRNEEPLPSKKELKKAAELLESLAGGKAGSDSEADDEALSLDDEEMADDGLESDDEDESAEPAAKPAPVAATKKAAKKAAKKASKKLSS